LDAGVNAHKCINQAKGSRWALEEVIGGGRKCGRS
jgi:hypothetical protein